MGSATGRLASLCAAAFLVAAACGRGTGGGGDAGRSPVASGTAAVLRQGEAMAELCLLVAETAQERERGLSGRDGLEPFDGMLFVFPKPSVYRFWMKDTRFPLELVPVGEQGDLDVDPRIRMKPCPGADCPTYAPPDPYERALELPTRGLERWGFATTTGAAPIRFDLGRGACR